MALNILKNIYVSNFDYGGWRRDIPPPELLTRKSRVPFVRAETV